MEVEQLTIERTNVLGVGISAINIPMALEVLDAWIKQKHHTYVCITGVHGVMESQTDPELRRIHNQAGLVTPDGMPMVWMSHLAGHKHVDRVYGPDLMLAVCEVSAKRGYRHFFYGGNEGVPELLRDKLQQKFSGLQVVGTFSPPFRSLTPEEDAAIVAQINAAQPDIVWVGLSTPKQERWMAAHLGKVQAPVMVGVGAAFDFHAGLKPQAPRWIQRSGMEWFFRMVSEPRRLARRYLQNNPRFVFAVLMQLLGLRRYKLDI